MATSKQAWLTRSDDQTSLWIGFFYHQVTSAERLRPVERLGIELAQEEANKMDGIIYLVGLVVVVMAVLSLLGLH